MCREVRRGDKDEVGVDIGSGRVGRGGSGP